MGECMCHVVGLTQLRKTKNELTIGEDSLKPNHNPNPNPNPNPNHKPNTKPNPKKLRKGTSKKKERTFRIRTTTFPEPTAPRATTNCAR